MHPLSKGAETAAAVPLLLKYITIIIANSDIFILTIIYKCDNIICRKCINKENPL